MAPAHMKHINLSLQISILFPAKLDDPILKGKVKERKAIKVIQANFIKNKSTA